MSIWFLQQNEMVNEVNFKSSDNILPPATNDECCGTSDECYPPQDQVKIDDNVEVYSKQRIQKRLIKSVSYL